MLTLFDLSVLKNKAEELGCIYLEDEMMSEYTSFKIGGKCDAFICPDSVSKLCEIVKICFENQIPTFILGCGSNILVSDFGIRGAVIHIGSKLSKIETYGQDEIICEAGARLSTLCNFALKNSLSGLEFAFGIPGSVGGAAFMNAGAYGGEMKDVIVGCYHVTPTGDIGYLSINELGLGYRSSVYQQNNYIITAVKLKLKKALGEEIQLKMNDFMERRISKQPLNFPSAGSVFKRPQGFYSGALIEECGLKSACVGGAMVSPKHAGFIINTGNASANDVKMLVSKVQKEIINATGIELECEIKFVGEIRE